MADDDEESDDEDIDPRPRDVWSVLIEGVHADKVRPAVVMAHHDDLVEVVFGSGRPHPAGNHLVVAGGTRRAEQMGLTKGTHFWHSSVRLVQAYCFDDYLGECPAVFFGQLAKLAFNYHRNNPPDDE